MENKFRILVNSTHKNIVAFIYQPIIYIDSFSITMTLLSSFTMTSTYSDAANSGFRFLMFLASQLLTHTGMTQVHFQLCNDLLTSSSVIIWKLTSYLPFFPSSLLCDGMVFDSEKTEADRGNIHTSSLSHLSGCQLVLSSCASTFPTTQNCPHSQVMKSYCAHYSSKSRTLTWQLLPLSTTLSILFLSIHSVFLKGTHVQYVYKCGEVQGPENNFQELVLSFRTNLGC